MSFISWRSALLISSLTNLSAAQGFQVSNGQILTQGYAYENFPSLRSHHMAYVPVELIDITGWLSSTHHNHKRLWVVVSLHILFGYLN
jgi:hypothetical protein